MINTSSRVAFIGTLKGPAQAVSAATNKAIIFGDPLNTLTKIARTGEFATDSAGEVTEARWTGFTALALPGGFSAAPIFVGKTTGKNNLGLWGRDSSGKVRRLIGLGDNLGGQVVKKFVVLNSVPKVFTAPRSFDAAGSVAVLLTFKDNKTAIVRIGIP